MTQALLLALRRLALPRPGARRPVRSAASARLPSGRPAGGCQGPGSLFLVREKGSTGFFLNSFVPE